MTVQADQFVWCPGPLPPALRVVQVYGWLFDDHGRVLIQRTPAGKTNLPGGTPEPGDGDVMATLHREAMEESQVRVGTPVMLGHERLSSGRAAGYVRAAARIAAVLPRRPDADGGRLLGRTMVAWYTAVELLGWGPAGAAQGRAAADVAEARWGLAVHAPSLPDADLP